MEGPVCGKPNMLSSSRSPYLRMHSCDPVDWHSWSDVEPLLGSLERPLFISIGYSSCHWCHVMHRESFQNPEVAEWLNRAFIPVKVDREERPDVDEYYMAYCMVASGRCGWPLNVITMPDGKPFFVATYMKPQDLIAVSRAVYKAWFESRGDLERVASQASQALEALYRPRGVARLGKEVFQKAYAALESSFDPLHGGFGGAPKFPEQPKHVFLMYYHARMGSEDALHMVVHTLSRMIAGGIHDKVWGGFHRYTVDREWRLPHFEKMLYDQGSLARVLGEALASGASLPELVWAAGRLVDFLERDMLTPEGGLASAIDAEAGGVEGGGYTWTLAELEEALGGELFEFARRLFGLSRGGNYLDEATGKPSGRNLLHVPATLGHASGALGMEVPELLSIIDRIGSELRRYHVEKSLPRPARDNKVLTSWNSLAVWGLSSIAPWEPRALGLAEKVAGFIESEMIDGTRVYRAWMGEPYIDGMLDDYAHLALAMITLHEASGKERYMVLAYEVAREIPKVFQDIDGTLRLRPSGPVELQDSSYPSGLSAAIDAMLRLGRLFGDKDLLDSSEKAIKSLSRSLAESPLRYAHTLIALDFMLGPSYEIVVSLPSRQIPSEVAEVLRNAYTPARIVYWRPPSPKAAEVASHISSMVPIEGKPTIYVCQEGVCSLPTTDPKEAIKAVSTGYRAQEL